ncbi:class I SAM-dependent methyltransferase [Thermomonospora cellulosilytica]|uniref:SAM-dependent methyltransferase n=1 Tax=Thermomonospora cellulosilytica TaxID=1411118 RepID=A0A7W3MZ03_9ACTN|nr:class I SAM-dependent methyltransferase [Thermomonospora cellulosilytica]MBA9004503.1 SAM-dependent methyltransferase [Thermomonospora cellulosilytica]
MADPDYITVNKALWDERVPIHLASDFYDVAGFKAGGQALREFELAEVGEVAGRRLVHLQCHFGLDTLSWARRGAQVTGLDFSEKAVEAARALADEVGLPARFVTADVYDAPTVLGETYDIVYTGLGALCWLPDIDRWARVVASLLHPGGFAYLAEFHPFADTLDDAEGRTVAFDYFAEGPQVWDEPGMGSYADPQAPVRHTRSIEFAHGLGEVVTALATAGLRIDFLHEHDHTLWQRFSTLERHGIAYRIPEGRPRIPLMYSLRATKPFA